MARARAKTAGFSLIVAEDERHRLVCSTPGFRYKPDVLRYVYGKSKRRPLESWFLDELAFFRQRYPNHEIFTLGSSCVFGEKFVNYLTICEFSVAGQKEFDALKEALWHSDQAIRRKFWPMWKWDMAAHRGWDIVFMVGHLDLAYFLQHRAEFRGAAHGRYMRAFTSPETEIRSADFKVLQNGLIVEFDPTRLDEADRFVYEHHGEIRYETQLLKSRSNGNARRRPRQ